MKTLQWNVVFLCLLLSACLNSDNSSVTASRTDTNENGPPVIVDPPPGNGGGNGGGGFGGLAHDVLLGVSDCLMNVFTKQLQARSQGCQ